MTEPWAAERAVDADLARALLAAQFPDLAGARVEPFGLGWDNTAYLVGGAWVFRFPRRSIAVPLVEREARLLPVIAPRLPLAVPVPERLGHAEERYPWPFAGYRLLPGRTACGAALDEAQRAACAGPIARFLAALHAFPAEDAAALGAGGDTIGRMDIGKRAPRGRAYLADLEQRGILGGGERRVLEGVLDAAPPDGAPGPAVLVHGDLYARHLLVDGDGRAAGIIDWGDVHLGDRAVDLAVAFAFLPPAAREAFFHAYGPVDAPTLCRARFRAAYHASMLTRYAHQTGDEDLLREGRLALRWAAG